MYSHPRVVNNVTTTQQSPVAVTGRSVGTVLQIRLQAAHTSTPALWHTLHHGLLHGLLLAKERPVVLQQSSISLT
jgi:hypothetical protein